METEREFLHSVLNIASISVGHLQILEKHLENVTLSPETSDRLTKSMNALERLVQCVKDRQDVIRKQTTSGS